MGTPTLSFLPSAGISAAGFESSPDPGKGTGNRLHTGSLGPPPSRAPERRPHPCRKPRLLCKRPHLRGRTPPPASGAAPGEVRAPSPLQWGWHVEAPARTGSAGCPPSQEEFPAVLRARLRRDHISASTKTGNGGAGPEMPLKGRGGPGFLFPGGEQGPWGRRPGLLREQALWSLWRQLPLSIYSSHRNRWPDPRPPFLGASERGRWVCSSLDQSPNRRTATLACH